jgi:hypothetical protein
MVFLLDMSDNIDLSDISDVIHSTPHSLFANQDAPKHARRPVRSRARHRAAVPTPPAVICARQSRDGAITDYARDRHSPSPPMNVAAGFFTSGPPRSCTNQGRTPLAEPVPT